jgi:hypothetical protein
MKPHRSMGKRVDVPRSPCQRPTMHGETIKQFSLTRAARLAEAAPEKQMLITSWLYRMRLLNPSKKDPFLCIHL